MYIYIDNLFLIECKLVGYTKMAWNLEIAGRIDAKSVCNERSQINLMLYNVLKTIGIRKLEITNELTQKVKSRRFRISEDPKEFSQLTRLTIITDNVGDVSFIVRLLISRF